MKKHLNNFIARAVFLLLALLNGTLLWAQDQPADGGSVTVSKTTTSSSTTMTQDWYTQPWVWIVGAAIFILLLVALTRGGSSSRDVRRTTTIRRDVSTD